MNHSHAAILAYALAMLLMLGYAGVITIALGRARQKVRPSRVPVAAGHPRAAATAELKPEGAVRAS